jgi:hypothetical protein
MRQFIRNAEGYDTLGDWRCCSRRARRQRGLRLTRKLKALRQEAWRLKHVPLSVQHRWYTSVLLGYYGYYGRPQNLPALHALRQEMIRIWLTCLRRRSQKSRRMSWQTFADVVNRFPLPTPRITHPWTVRAA